MRASAPARSSCRSALDCPSFTNASINTRYRVVRQKSFTPSASSSLATLFATVDGASPRSRAAAAILRRLALLAKLRNCWRLFIPDCQKYGGNVTTFAMVLREPRRLHTASTIRSRIEEHIVSVIEHSHLEHAALPGIDHVTLAGFDDAVHSLSVWKQEIAAHTAASTQLRRSRYLRSAARRGAYRRPRASIRRRHDHRNCAQRAASNLQRRRRHHATDSRAHRESRGRHVSGWHAFALARCSVEPVSGALS